jgi:hypothetical protein
LGLKITFIGNFTEQPPNQTQSATFNRFLENLINKEILVENYFLLFENQLTSSETPASKTIEALSSLERFHASKTLHIYLKVSITLKTTK